MLKRTLTGLALVALLFGFIVAAYFVSSIFIDLLILVFMAGSVYEMYSCLKKAGYTMFPAPAIFVLLAAYPTFYLLQHFLGNGNTANVGLQGLLIVLLVGVMLTLTIFTFKPAKHSVKEIAAAKEEGIPLAPEEAGACGIGDLLANVFVLIYPVMFLSMAWAVSFKYCAIFAVMYAVFLPVIGSDTFAYFVGSLLGKRKLCPKISPKKTVAGAVGGVMGSVIVSLLFWLFFEFFNVLPESGYVFFIDHAVSGWEWKTALIYIALGFAGGITAELGDLAASRIKRAIGVKDYGNVFPGHGGFLDRMDSIMYCLVVLLIAFTAIYGY